MISCKSCQDIQVWGNFLCMTGCTGVGEMFVYNRMYRCGGNGCMTGCTGVGEMGVLQDVQVWGNGCMYGCTGVGKWLYV